MAAKDAYGDIVSNTCKAVSSAPCGLEVTCAEAHVDCHAHDTCCRPIERSLGPRFRPFGSGYSQALA